MKPRVGIWSAECEQSSRSPFPDLSHTSLPRSTPCSVFPPWLPVHVPSDPVTTAEPWMEGGGVPGHPLRKSCPLIRNTRCGLQVVRKPLLPCPSVLGACVFQPLVSLPDPTCFLLHYRRHPISSLSFILFSHSQKPKIFSYTSVDAFNYNVPQCCIPSPSLKRICPPRADRHRVGAGRPGAEDLETEIRITLLSFTVKMQN